MLDFSGFMDNIRTALIGDDDPPYWLFVSSFPLGGAGAAGVLILWWEHEIDAWPLLVASVVAALVLHWAGLATPLFSPRAFFVPMGHTAALAGLLCVFGPRLLPGLEPAAAREAWIVFATVAATLAWPVLSRLWWALFFSLDLARRMEDREALVAAAMAGESSDLVVRVAEAREEGYELERLGAEEGASLWASSDEVPALAKHLGRSRIDATRTHFLLRGQTLEERPRSGAGYRESTMRHELVAVDEVLFLGHGPDGVGPETFMAEVRAGVVLLVFHNALVASLAYWAATSLRGTLSFLL